MKKLALFVLLLLPFMAGAQVIITVAGGNGEGFAGDGGPATNAKINGPYNLGIDDSGNLYIADEINYCIRKVDHDGIIKTICGNGSPGYSGDGGLALHAEIYGLVDFAFDHNGNMYISEGSNHCIRKVDVSGIITTVVGTGVSGYSGDGGPASAAQLRGPTGLVMDDTGNLYINDYQDHRIRKVNASGIISTIAGNGISGFSPDGSRADTAKMLAGGNIRIDKLGNLYFADNIRIRCLSPSGILTTVTGTGTSGYSGDGGPATAAEIDGGNVAIDKSGTLYFADQGNHRIRKISAEGLISTIAGIGFGGNTGDGGDPLLAKLCAPSGIAIDTVGNIYIGTVCSESVREITLDTPLAVTKFNVIDQQFIISPNPSKGCFDILIKWTYSIECNLSITDTKGKTLKALVIQSNKQERINTELPPGHYLISVMVGQQYYSQKLIIQ